MVQRDASSPEPRYWIGVSREASGGILVLTGNPDVAVTEIRAATEVFSTLSAEHPENAAYRRELWFARSITTMSLCGIGDAKIWVPSALDFAAAEREEREAVAVAEHLAKRDLGDTRAALELSESLDHVAAVMGERDPAAALPLFQRGREVFAALPPSFRSSGYATQFERFGRCAMAVSLAKQGRRAEALGEIEQGVRVALQNAQVDGASFEDQLGPWMCRYQAARARRALGDSAEAIGLLEAIAEGLGRCWRRARRTSCPTSGWSTPWGCSESRSPSAGAPASSAPGHLASWPGASTPYLRRRQAALDAARPTARTGP